MRVCVQVRARGIIIRSRLKEPVTHRQERGFPIHFAISDWLQVLDKYQVSAPNGGIDSMKIRHKFGSFYKL